MPTQPTRWISPAEYLAMERAAGLKSDYYNGAKKSGHLRQIPSLQEYLLVDHDEPHAKLYARQDDGHWLLTEVSGIEKELVLPRLGGRILLAEIYRRVTFESANS